MATTFTLDELYGEPAQPAARPASSGWRVSPEEQAGRDSERMRILQQEASDPDLPGGAASRAAVSREIQRAGGQAPTRIRQAKSVAAQTTFTLDELYGGPAKPKNQFDPVEMQADNREQFLTELFGKDRSISGQASQVAKGTVKNFASLGDMLLGIPHQAMSFAADLDTRLKGLMQGKSHADVSKEAEARVREIMGGAPTPLSKLTSAIFDDGIPSNVDHAMEKVDGFFDTVGNKVQTATGGALRREDVKSLVNETFAIYGVKGVGAAGKAKVAAMEKAAQAEGQPKPLTSEQVAQERASQQADAAVEATAEAKRLEARANAEPAALAAQSAERLRGQAAQREAALAEQKLQATETKALKAKRADVRAAFAEDPLWADYLRDRAETEALVREGRQAEATRLQPEEMAPRTRPAERTMVDEQARTIETVLGLPPDQLRVTAPTPLTSGLAKVARGRSFDLDAAELSAIKQSSSQWNRPNIQRGGVDVKALGEALDDLTGMSLEEVKAMARALPKGVEIKETPTGFEAFKDGKRVGYLNDNLKRGQAEQIGENANIDIVKVDKEVKGQGVGAALYRAFAEKHAGRIAPSGKTTADAWKVWRRDYPEKVEQFAEQEAARIKDGAPPEIVLGNITDPVVAQRVLARVAALKAESTVDTSFANERNKQLVAEENLESKQMFETMRRYEERVAFDYLAHDAGKWFEAMQPLLGKVEKLRELEPFIKDAQLNHDARLSLARVQDAFKLMREAIESPKDAPVHAQNIRFLLQEFDHTALQKRYVEAVQEVRNGLNMRSPRERQLAKELDSVLQENVVAFSRKGERGVVDPELLKKAGAASAGALLAMYFADDNQAGAAGLGAVGGLLLAGKMGTAAIKGADYGLGLVSTRIRNISEPLLKRARDYEGSLLRNAHVRIAAADPFLQNLNKLKGPDAAKLDLALVSNDAAALKAVLDKHPEMRAQWEAVAKTIQETGRELTATGVLKNLRQDYLFPRIVTDRVGLLDKLGVKAREGLEQALHEAEAKAVRATGEGLSTLEESQLINQYLRGGRNGQGGPGFTKSRVIEEVTAELRPFYAPPTEALHTYLSSATRAIEKTKFFGKNLIKGEDGRIDTNASIGEVVRRELEAGKIDYKQAQQLREMLESRFGAGERGASPLVQHVRNLTNAGLLGNVVSAASQLGDTMVAVYAHGMRPTLEALTLKIAGKQRVTAKDFGLVDHISEEFVSTNSSAKFLNQVFKWSGFTAIDLLGKDVHLNAALTKFERLAKTPKGQAEIAGKYKEAFGDDYPALIEDLKSRKLTDNTRSLLFSELSDMQPISKLEMPQGYLDMPNGRFVYMLKSFMLKQVDIVRRDAYKKIIHGKTRAERITGLGNLLKFSLALGIAGASTDMLQNWIMGRKVDFDKVDLAANMLKTFGWSAYTADKVKQGKPLEAVRDVALPPYKMWDDIIRRDPKAVQYFPVGGKLFYSHEMGGAEKVDANKAKAEKRKAKKEKSYGL